MVLWAGTVDFLPGRSHGDTVEAVLAFGRNWRIGRGLGHHVRIEREQVWSKCRTMVGESGEETAGVLYTVLLNFL